MNVLNLHALLVLCLLPQNVVVAVAHVHIHPSPDTSIPFHVHLDGQIHYEHGENHHSHDSDEHSDQDVLVINAQLACLLATSFELSFHPVFFTCSPISFLIPASIESAESADPFGETNRKIYRENCALVL